MPKKPARNAFYFFMKELEPQLRREGRVFPNGMQDVVPIAHPRWKGLPEKEKARFENMAKKEKARMRGHEGDQYKMDNQGKLLAHRKDPHTEMKKRRDGEKKDMRKNWPPGKALKEVPFYFINFQTLCKTDEGDYLPAEIAIIEYSIEKGITKHLHRFIQPGKIPTGYRFTCIENSESTHQIPVDNFELADDNYVGLWIQIENFINPAGEKPQNPPFFCLGALDRYEPVEYCLEWIHGRSRIGEPNRMKKVYEIESLFQEMFAHLGTEISKAGLIDKLTSSDWDYEPGTKCDYHEKKEAKECALGIVKRYAFAISDAICEKYDVPLTDKHIPVRKNMGSVTVLSPSSMPVCNKQESRLPTQTERPFQKQEPDYTQLRRPKPSGPDFQPHTVGDKTVKVLYNRTAPDYPVLGGAMSTSETSGAGGGPWDYSFRGPVGTDFQPHTVGDKNVEVLYNRTTSDFPALGAGGGPGDYPSRGRGLTIGMQGMSLENKHAGRAGPPPPTQAPIPPPSWQHPSMMASQQSLGIGRGISSRAPPPQFANADNDDGPEVVPLRLPGQMAPIRQQAQYQPPVQQYNDPPRRATNGGGGDGLSMGVGRGSDTLMKLMTQGRKPGVPVGRGYAPPHWVDDGSIGPIRS